MASPTSPSPAGAVFLSYAREDTEVARRVAEALRAFGIEVWFDQNELRGGDTWDSKIRSQIKTCALFVPLISRQTEERAEGYFRREWKLAVDRTHDMAGGKAFIVPVVLDDTPESGASVPEEFMRYQWTRLADGAPSPEFVAQVKRLLETPRKSPAAPTSNRTAAPFSSPTPVMPPPAQVPAPRRQPWPAYLGAAVLVIGAVAFYLLRPTAPTPPPAAPAPSAVPPVAAPQIPAPPAKSIAVLPFANLSADKENEFFAEGVHDDIITSLAKIRDLTVISRTSVLAYRDTASRNLKRIAADLGVANVLEGSVRRAGNKVQVNAQLIDARTDAHVWAETFSGDASDIFALQAKLAQQIAGALKATLTAGERTLIERRPTENAGAHDLYVRARTRHQELGEGAELPAYDQVIALYEQAATLDPAFALAHAQAAMVHLLVYWFGNLDPSPARRDRAKAAVDAAARLAPDAPETHLAKGAYHYRVERDWNQALAEFHQAERGLPNDAQLSFWIAVSHRRLGRWLESLAHFERSLTLNPREGATATNYTAFLLELRRVDQARAVIARALGFFPGDRDLLESQAVAQFATDGDVAALSRAIASLPAGTGEAIATLDRFRGTMLARDWAAADRIIAESRFDSLPDWNGRVIRNPTTLYRALVAYVREGSTAARPFADQAIATLAAGKWNDRQRPWMKMKTAYAHALAGRAEEARREGEAAMKEVTVRDVYDAVQLRLEHGAVQVTIGRQDDALATLRELLAGPCTFSPNDFRIDPLWSRLKSDPRFEEILKSAKPL